MTRAREDAIGRLHDSIDPFAGFNPAGWEDPTDELFRAFAAWALWTAVVVLFGVSSPTAVVWVVALVVVYAVEGMLRRWLVSYVGKESGEVVSPLIANGNPTPAIVGVLRSVGVVAAVQHRAPSDVFGRSGVGGAVTMSGVALSDLLALKATTTLATANAQGTRYQDAFCATGAPAPPVALMVRHVGEAKHFPAAEGLSRFVDAVRVRNVHVTQYTPRIV